MDDDDLTRLLRESNPTSPRADEPLSVRHRQILASIISEKPRHQRWPPQRVTRALAIPVTVVVAILAVLVVVVQPFGASPATAYGPVPLVFQAVDRSAEEVIEMLAEESHSDVAPQRVAVTTTWDLVINDVGEPQQTVVISPTITELTWTEELSGRLKVTAGEPYFATGATGDVPLDETYPPGSDIDSRVFSVGEYQPLAPDAGTLNSATARGLLDSLAPDSTRAGDAIRAIRLILGEWTLSDSQLQALLRALLDYDGLTVLGTAEDRLGHPVLGFQGSSSIPGQAATLLVSTATGRVVGYETSVVHATEALPVPVGTVTSYAIWKGNQ